MNPFVYDSLSYEDRAAITNNQRTDCLEELRYYYTNHRLSFYDYDLHGGYDEEPAYDEKMLNDL